MSHGGWGTSRIKRQTECHPKRQHYAKGLCRQCYRNTPTFKSHRAAYYQANRERWQIHGQRTKLERRKLQSAHGISKAQMDAMLLEQNGCCAICGDKPKRRQLALDHCHKTGKIRGFLCHPCNGGLGLFRDNQLRLMAAWQYLQRHHGD